MKVMGLNEIKNEECEMKNAKINFSWL